MKKLFVIAVVILIMITMSTASFATENEVVDSQTTTDVQQTENMLGDVNANGEIDATDYTLLKRAYFGIYEVGGEVEMYSDTNESGGIDATDYVLLKRAYFGIYELARREEEPIVDVMQTYCDNYDEYVDFLEKAKLPDYFISYEDLAGFGEFAGFLCPYDVERNGCDQIFYSFVDETGTEFSMYVEYIPKLPNDYTKQIPEIDSKNINASDMRTVNFNGTTAIKYSYQGIEYVYSKYGTIMSMSWQYGDIRYILSGIGDYPITDKDTAVNRLLNLETATAVISNMKGSETEINN